MLSCGAVVLINNVVFLFQFFLFLFVIFALEIAAAIWGFANKEKVGCS